MHWWQFIYAGAIFVVLLLSFKSQKYLIYGYVFFLPWAGLTVDLGVQLNIDRLISFIMLLLAVTFIGKLVRLGPVLLFLIYAFVVTCVLSLLFLPETANEFPPLRGKYRWAIQITMWSLLFAPVFFFQTLKKIGEIQKIYKILLISIIILCVLGWVQVLSYFLFNFDPFPIGILNPEDILRQGIFDFQGTPIFRMSSLGGEPKHFAYSIVTVLSIMFIQILYGKNRKSIGKKKLAIFLFLLFSLILTFSTQGFGLLLVDLISITFLSVYVLKDVRINKVVYIVFLLFMSLSVLIYFERDILQVLNERTFLRLQESGFIEDWNDAVLGFLREHPKYWFTGVGLGNIHLYAKDYIPGYALHHMFGEVFIAKSGFLRLISEVGMIGFLFFLYAYFKPVFALKKIRHINGRNDFGEHIVLSIVVFINFLISANGPPYVFFIMAISYSTYSLSRRGRSNGFVHNNKFPKPTPG